jgi:hypothetical protein
VSREEAEFSIVGKPDEGKPAPPKGFRIAKVVRMPESGTYLVPMPGLMPAGLKFSFHPSGEFHLKSRDDGMIARLNLFEVVRAIANGGLEQLASSLLRAPSAGLTAKGVLVPPSLISKFSGGAKPGSGDLALPADDLAQLDRVEIDDTVDLRADIDWLRREGLLPPQAILLLQVGDAEQPAVFVSAGGQPIRLPESARPAPGSPFSNAFGAMARLLEEYGGIWVTFPGEGEMKGLLERAGFGEFFDGLKRWAESLDQKVSVEDVLAGPMLEVLAGSAVMKMLEQPPLRPRPPGHGEGATGGASGSSP